MSQVVAVVPPPLPVAGERSNPDPLWFALGYALAVAGAVGGWLLCRSVRPHPFVPPAGMGMFALLYVFAQAIERGLEPLSTLLDSKTGREAAAASRNDAHLMAIAARDPESLKEHLELARQCQHVLDKLRNNKAIVLWGAASFLAMLASGGFGVYLLRMIGVWRPGKFIDILITGLVVGAGTKPLHDLIANIQSAKEKKQDR